MSLHQHPHSFPTRRSSDLSPPFGSSEYLLRTPPDLKQGYKLLEVFSSFSLYSNCTATLQPHCTSLTSGTRNLLPCRTATDRKSTRLNSSHANISYAVFCLK